MKKWALPSLLLISLVLNGVLGYRFIVRTEPRELNTEYPYLSKRIFAKNQNDILINFSPLRAALREYVGAQDGKVGVYFEYLPSGTSIGVNDSKEVKIASLSKVPLVMSIFKKIQNGELSLTDKLVVKKSHLDEQFGTLWKRGEGTEISVKDLILLNFNESDNTAYNVLFDQLNGSEIDEVYNSLDINLGQETTADQTYLLISPKNYSSVFRSLYLSSFVSEKYSNTILDLLSKTPFDDKLVAGVPKDIKVAHKIGVFETADKNTDLFTDCGIVYLPRRPYALCVFVKDTDKEAQRHMSFISKMVYEYVNMVKAK